MKYVSIFPKFNKNTPPQQWPYIFPRRIYLGLEVSTYPGWVVVVPSLCLTVYGMRPLICGEFWAWRTYPSRERGHIPAWEKEKHFQKVPFFGGTCFFSPGV